jgi:hypothetical protein
VFSVTDFTALLDSGFQRRTFPFMWVPELSLASATTVSFLITATLNWLPSDSLSNSYLSRSQTYVTTDGQSASLSWCQAPVWGQRPDFYYSQTVTGFSLRGALSSERTCLPFTVATGSCQRGHSRVRVPRDSWPYFTVSYSRLLQPGGQGLRICLPQALGSLFVTSYDSQGCDGGIRIRLHAAVTDWWQLVLIIYHRHGPHRKGKLKNSTSQPWFDPR